MQYTEKTGLEIAVVGMAGRFPGAKDVSEFWQNLKNGVESISVFTEEEVLAAGINEALVANPAYVRARGILGDIDKFDATFFGYSPKEAASMDPQHRIFLETAWKGLEDAGYNPEYYDGNIGVYASVGFNSYLVLNMEVAPDFMNAEHGPQAMLGNDKDFLANRVSYKLNLTGPSVVVQSACSSSLVAIHQACQSLISGEADMQIAGGITIRVPEKSGSLYQEGMINSPDGKTRAYDKDAAGTVAGNGVGVVVLKRLEDAIEDRDHIYAVVKATAINNDGDDKVGYSAPSAGGQTRVIEAAQAMAEVPAGTIGFIEGHGSGTKMGDPIEVEALREAFSAQTDATGFCALGSVKSNVGHLDAAAGVAGFMKTVLALYHRQIPPSVNFQQPNPLCEFENSPFFVNSELLDWKTENHSRRAGVSSFGMGGTNAHVILEQAPARAGSETSRPWQMLCLSAKTPTALDRLKDQLREDMKTQPDLLAEDIAYTLHMGRHHFNNNSFVLCRDTADACEKISMGHNDRIYSAVWDNTERAVTFMFSGQGAQYCHMGRELYEQEAAFRRTVDQCAEILQPHLGLWLPEVLFPAPGQAEQASTLLDQTSMTQPALFTLEYSLATLLISWGIQPEAMIGHSIGEYVAATLAGVFNLEDALYLVAERGRLIQSLPEGDMLFIPQSAAEVEKYLSDHIALGTANSPMVSVLSGDRESIATLQQQLEAEGVRSKVIRTSHAFHSHMMEPALEDFKALFNGMTLQAPETPVISNITGDWLTEEQATDPVYWTNHLRNTVNFVGGIEKLSKGQSRIFLEVGPGESLSQFVKQTLGQKSSHLSVALLEKPNDISVETEASLFTTLRGVGNLWLQGVSVDWAAFYADQQRNRLSLNTYPFMGNSYWVNLNPKNAQAADRNKDDIYWLPQWSRQPLDVGAAIQRDQAVFFVNQSDGSLIYDKLAGDIASSCLVTVGEQYENRKTEYTLRSDTPSDYKTLFQDLKASLKAEQVLDLYVFLSAMDTDAGTVAADNTFTCLAQALADFSASSQIDIRLQVIASTTFEVQGGEEENWRNQFVVRYLQALYQVAPSISWQFIDAGDLLEGGDSNHAAWKLLKNDIARFSASQCLAYRQGRRWTQATRAFALTNAPETVQADTHLFFTELNEYTAQFIKGWSELNGGRVAIALEQELEPETQWAELAEQGNETCQQAIMLRENHVPIEFFQCVPGDQERVSAVYKQCLNSGTVGVVVLLPEQNGSESDALFQSDYRYLADISQRYAALINVLTALSPAYSGWFSLQPSLMAYPSHVADFYRDCYLQQQLKQQGQYLVYLNNDLFGQDFTQDWIQRADLSERMSAVAKTVQCSATDSFWMSASDAAFYRWQPGNTSVPTALQEHAQQEQDLYVRPELSTPYAAPITERQKIICALWQEMFQIDKVGIHDNFFDLGGDSVLALKLLSNLEVYFDVALPLSEVINSPTVAEQANSVVEYSEHTLDQREASPLVKLQSEGDNPPFFAVHPAGGIVHCYIEMSRILGKEQPFYAFQHPGIDGKSGPYTSYKKMAELYIKAMQEVQPEGPYFIGGWSFGGTVAFEMAVQLTAQGHEVAMLTLFDSPGPSDLYKLNERPDFEFSGMLAFLSQALATMFGGEIELSVDEMRKIPPGEQLDYVLERMVTFSGDEELGSAKESLERIIDIFEVTDKGEKEYEPTPYDGDIHMYRVQQLADYEFTGYKNHPQLESATFGWEELTSKEVKVQFVPGTHISMIFPPNVQVLADKFKEDLFARIAEINARQTGA